MALFSRLAWFLPATLAAALSCSSDTDDGASSGSGGSGAGAASGSSATGAGTGVGGASMCAGQSCALGQICVNPCCGGEEPPCYPAPEDGGAGPAGTHAVDSCPRTGMPGCDSDPCMPPAPYCADSAPAGCEMVVDGQAYCVCA